MSQVTLQGNASGTGIFTLAAPNSNTNRTLNLPDAAGTVATTANIPTVASTAEAEAGTNNTNFITPLRMREGFNASGSAPIYAARAWVNFDGTGTPSIRASGNVGSITDTALGVFRINFSTSMPDINYAANVSINSVSGGSALVQPYVDTISSVANVTVRCLQNSGASPADTESTFISVFR